MRKRRRLANKMTIMVCAVLIAFSAFFYAPMNVSAEESVMSGSVYLSDFQEVTPSDVEYNSEVSEILSGNSSFNVDLDYYIRTSFIDLGSIDFSSYVSSQSSLYKVTYDLNYDFGFSHVLADVPFYLANVAIYESEDSTLLYLPTVYSDYANPGSYSITEYCTAEDLQKNLTCSFIAYCARPQTCSLSLDVSFTNIVVESVSTSGSNEYQNGYNAGYQQGQTDGYNNGYSQGFIAGEDSGFQAGQNSVDTQSFYNAGFSAGYDEGFSDGYSTGYNAGYEEGRNVNGTISSSKYLTGYASELVSGNDFYVASNSINDVEHFIIGSEVETLNWFDTQLGVVHVDSDINYRIPIASTHGSSVYVEGDGIHQVFSLNLTPYLTHDSISGTLLKDCSISEVYVVYQGNKYYATLSYGLDGSVNAFFDFYAPLDIGHTVLNNTSHDVHVKMQCSALLANDSGVNGHMYTGVFITPKIHFVCRVSDFNYSVYFSDDISGSIIQDQTDEITGSLDSGFNDLTNGFDNSRGDSVNSDLSAGLNEFQTAEDSLFSTASSSLSDYQFFNLSSVPAMVTGISFVSSIMTSWFNQAGGASGVGIVLSILFSIMLVAMVLGLYRWYQSKGGKD